MILKKTDEFVKETLITIGRLKHYFTVKL